MLHEERRKACDHLEYQTAQSPPVDGKTYLMSLLKNLRRQILWRSCDEIVLLNLVYFAAQSEINQFDKAIFVD